MKGRKKGIKRVKKARPKKAGKVHGKNICERYNEDAMCYRCLDLARSLLLSSNLDDTELKRVRKVMTDIINKKGVLKDDVSFLNSLSDEYLG